MDAGSGKTPSSVASNTAMIRFSFSLSPSGSFANFIKWAFNTSSTEGSQPRQLLICWFLSPSSSDVAMSTMIISIYCQLDETAILYWKNDNNPKKLCQLEDINNQKQLKLDESFPGASLRSAECGVRSAECGVRSAECGVRSAECGVRSAECGVRSAESRVALKQTKGFPKNKLPVWINPWTIQQLVNCVP